MKVVIQRVSKSTVTIDGSVTASIGQGVMVLAGFTGDDTREDIEWVAAKIIRLRIFDDNEGVMNLSVADINGELLIVSQFTLHAKTRKGNRPSYTDAAPPETAIPLYDSFVQVLEDALPGRVCTGKFGAEMAVELINDGPVTILIDSKCRE
jgi:D-tyrosyl-tRNA(Tyr) deacylase